MKQHDDDLHALAAAYALNALDVHERQAFITHLADCASCRTETDEFEATAARMAAAAAQEPPASLKRQVMAGVDHARQLPPRLTGAGAPATIWTVLRRRAAPLAVAASMAAAVSFAGVAAWQHQEGRESVRRAAQSEQRLDEVSALLAAPDARPVHARAGNGAVTTVVSSKRLNKAAFTAAGLPAPAPGKTYQLWLDHDGTMRPAGLIHRDGTVILDGDTVGASAVGLTLEPAGGSPRPTTAPLLLLRLPA